MLAPSIFISYSHKDERWKDRLKNHLGVLAKQGVFHVWDDRSINAGQDWFQEIKGAMDTARVAVLLVSANSLTSDFILREEVEHLLKRRSTEGMIIFPVIVEPCDWQAITWLSQMQVRPLDGHPLSRGRSHQINTDLTKIAKEVRQLLNHSTNLDSAQDSLDDPPTTSSPGSCVAVRTDMAAIEITIQRDISSYSQEEQKELLDAIKKFLAISGDVRVIRKRSGSVKLTLKLRPKDAERLLWAVRAGEFAMHDAVDAVLVERGPAEEPTSGSLRDRRIRLLEMLRKTYRRSIRRELLKDSSGTDSDKDSSGTDSDFKRVIQSGKDSALTKYTMVERFFLQLSGREMQVMRAIIDGRSNEVIALELGVSRSAVSATRTRLMSKLAKWLDEQAP